MKNATLGLCLLFLASSAFADVALTDTKTTARVLNQSATASPERQALHAANLAKREAKKSPGRSEGGVSSNSFRPGANTTGAITLIDSGFLKYFINTNITFSTSSSASGAASEASYTQAVSADTLSGGNASATLNDMFDGFNTLCVSLTNATGPCATGNAAYTIYNQLGPATTECSSRQVVFPAMTIGGLSVQRKVLVPSNDQFARWMESFTNTTGSPITFTMISGNNLGSDSATTLVTSSDGDAIAETTDTWITSFQNWSGTTSPDVRTGLVTQGVGAPTPVSNINFVNGDDNPYWVYSITLAAGETKKILSFVTGQPTRALAASKAAALALLPANPTQCMNPTELGQVANFVTETKADLSITKTANATSVAAFVPFTYTLAVSNAGPDAATNVVVTDTLNSNLAFQSASGTGWTCGAVGQVVTCTRPTLAVGAAPAITLTVVATAASGTATNTATVSGDDTDPTPNNASSTSAAVTFGPGGTIPALDPKMLVMLAVLLGLVSVVMIRRMG